MRVAITGAAGLFGHALVRIFGERHTVPPQPWPQALDEYLRTRHAAASS
ncbi:MAG TPA: hypothetical protein VL523_14485 [Terriglobia bacterium]|nr:hypothetical protein [Terriglobia bacterium]